MDPLPLAKIAELCGGQLPGDGVSEVSRISKDTRAIEPGDLYLALRGDNFDGNELVAAAATLVLEARIRRGLIAGTFEWDHRPAGDWLRTRRADVQCRMESPLAGETIG